MTFDRVRKEFKKTLWEEELDNERYINPAASPLELEFMKHYQGKKHQCKKCTQEYEEDVLFITKQGNYCSKCYQIMFKSK